MRNKLIMLIIIILMCVTSYHKYIILQTHIIISLIHSLSLALRYSINVYYIYINIYIVYINIIINLL